MSGSFSNWTPIVQTAPATWVFHRGSLGDSVLLWPMLRALKARGERVVLVTDGAKARLAARELGIDGIDAEQRRFNALWAEHTTIAPIAGVGRVIAFGPDEESRAGRTWIGNTERVFPGAEIETHSRRVDRPLAIAHAERFGGLIPPPARSNPSGPVALHVGAGSNEKRWPLERQLADLIGPIVALAGEVEADRFTPDERRMFEAMGGRFLSDLMELANVLTSARVFVGCDSGPTHLASALGVPTVALFGPTDPEEWGPIGPSVRVARAPAGDMRRLEMSVVAGEVRAFLP